VPLADRRSLIIDAARVKRLPTMFQEETLVAKGALVSYGTNFREAGRISAKHVQRILAGTSAKDLPVESYDRIELALKSPHSPGDRPDDPAVFPPPGGQGD
jgi:ABC-type uncharacterized transport system substrate-binding protein